MKLKNYLLLGSATLLIAACSSDDNNNQEKILDRVEIYYPSKAEYENAEFTRTTSKRVQYYENGGITLDSIFDGVNEEYRGGSKVHPTGNTKVETHFDASGIIQKTITYKYDSTGRLVEVKYQPEGISGILEITSFSYEADGKISCNYQNPPAEQLPNGKHTTNEEGLISGTISNNGISTNPFVYANGNIVSTESTNFTYYDTEKPSNLRMNTIQFNNYILQNRSETESYGMIGRHYLKSSSYANRTYESTFDDSGYILYTAYRGHDGTDWQTREFFYFYK